MKDAYEFIKKREYIKPDFCSMKLNRKKMSDAFFVAFQLILKRSAESKCHFFMFYRAVIRIKKFELQCDKFRGGEFGAY